ncbi:MAG: prephenate dehydrogenase/arogenate dehydrogenase family protein [Clostridia bacterium]|nr:prephenate dehydrogenase/arogenate dehydrogenase family protein [Clostridia bacterium]
MKICVAGLGLIGGSMCMSLKRVGYKVDGFNRSETALQFALSHNVCDKAVENFTDYDLVFVALPHQATIDFILNTNFKSGAIVSDICGVKRIIAQEVEKAKLPINYIGVHPMAGKEVSGVENACADLFDKASVVICDGEKVDPDILQAYKKIIADMGFKYIVECSSELHDKKIAYTSQLAHVVSNCYVNDGEIDGCLGFTGGSFQDMTRIAGVDENMWASLYLANSENLLVKADNLKASLEQFIKALQLAQKCGSEQPIKEFLSVGAKAYRAGKAENFVGDGIKVTALK